MRLNRRQSLQLLAASGFSLSTRPLSADESEPLPVAAIVTTYFRHSHADVLCGKIMEGWRQDGGPGPRLKLVSMYTDQVHAKDLSRGLAMKHGVRITQSIDEALTHGTDKLAVGGVLSIGEHGDYPANNTGQVKYPRRRFFDQIADTMQRCGQTAPVFSDKHLSWNWKDALHMYDRARKQKIPLMAGSSLPVTWRFPNADVPVGTQMKEIVTVGYGGFEAYGFHALESMQCIAERRKGGETGVASVSAVPATEIPAWLNKHPERHELLRNALKVAEKNDQKLEERVAQNSALFCLQYSDGFHATIAMLNGITDQFSTAVRLSDNNRVMPMWHRLQFKAPFGHFEHLLRGIEQMFHNGKPSWPVERTLLTTGILDRVMQRLSSENPAISVPTPELTVSYQPSSWGFANREGLAFPE